MRTPNGVYFPDQSTPWKAITLDFTVGCASGGCSDWDYDVDVEIGRPTGMMDSTIASIDTVSTAPLVLDTTWNAPYEIIEWFQVGRMITPTVDIWLRVNMDLVMLGRMNILGISRTLRHC